MADRWHLFENASAAFLAAVRSELPRLRKALSPERPVDPKASSKAKRLQWEAAMTREAVNGQVLALASQGVPLKAMARTTGLSRQTIRKIVRGQRHAIFRTRQSSLDPRDRSARSRVDRRLPRRRRTLAQVEGTGVCGFAARRKRMGYPSPSGRPPRPTRRITAERPDHRPRPYH